MHLDRNSAFQRAVALLERAIAARQFGGAFRHCERGRPAVWPRCTWVMGDFSQRR